MKAKVSTVKIGPNLAEKMLANILEEQRPLTNKQVERFANEMRSGNWRFSPDALVLIKGKLGNGQHRLQAVVRSKTHQDFLLMETDDDELYKVLDSGRTRTVADVLRGEYAGATAATARLVVLYDLGALYASGTGRKADQCTRSLQIEYALENHEQLVQHVRNCQHFYDQFRIVAVPLAAAVSFIATRDTGKTTEVAAFIENVYSGENSNDAAFDLRERILRSRIGAARLSRLYVFGLMIKSLRSYLNGTRMGAVRLNEGEPFPRL